MSEEKKVPNKKYGNQKLSECIEKLHLDLETADVYFEVDGGDGSVERVPAHKNLLAAVSKVFKAMFYGQLKEEGDVKLIDVTAEAMKEFLQFFYMREVEPTMANIAEVMHLGHKYDVTRCVDVCVECLKDNVTNDNICTGLDLAILYDQKELLKVCEKWLTFNTEAVFKSATFMECDKQTLAHILKMNLLSCSETQVFEACMSWVKAKSGENVVNKQLVNEHLGDLFYEIRFSSMAIGDFIDLSLSHDYAFSPDEYKDIIQTFASTGTSPKLFNGNPRQIQWNKDAVIKCKRVTPNGAEGYVSMHRVLTTTLSTNDAVLLGGFVCAKVSFWRDDKYCDLTSDLPIDITISEASDLEKADERSVRILSSFKGSLTSSSETIISLPVPVLIRPGFLYKIEVNSPPEGHRIYGKELMTEVKIENSVHDTTMILKFYNDLKTSNTNVFVSLIMAFEFNRI